MDSHLNSKADVTKKDQTPTSFALEGLGKLTRLSREDKTEAAMLRARIDEQSHLIMVLKQELDKSRERCSLVDGLTSEFLTYRESAENVAEHERKKFDMLNQRFTALSENHEEMIRIKDEYKADNASLRDENDRLLTENKRLFSKAITERDNRISCLVDKLVELEKLKKDLERDVASLHEELRSTGKLHSEREARSAQEIARLQSELVEAHLDSSRLSSSRDLCTQEISDLKKQLEVLKREMAGKVRVLETQRDKNMELALERGKALQEKQTDQRQLEEKMAASARALRELKAQHTREIEQVDVNSRVQRLKKDLAEAEHLNAQLTLEFQAYRRHTQELLDTERELNSRLRYVTS